MVASMLFRLAAFVLLLVPAAAIDVAPASAQAEPSIRVPPARGQGRPIPGRFIVTLQDRVDPRQVARENGVEPEFVYTRVLTGFAGRMSEAARSGMLRDR